MEQLIPIASKLQDVLGALGQNTTLDLPQIVVVGGQSSGKSSVLEGIVGRSFLPRGHGIVTRRPLILQLYNTSTPSSSPSQHDDDDDDDSKSSDVNRYDEDISDDDHHDNVKENQDQSNDFWSEDDNDDNIAADHRHDKTMMPSSKRQLPKNNKNTSSSIKTHTTSTASTTNNTQNSDEWGEFLHLPGKRFFDFTSIRKEIVRDTERLTGKNKGINPTPIHLKIYSPRVLALTLVDLPGIAKVAVGDQPPDIEDQIREMSLQYISNPNAIILAVNSANTDLANSDALKLAQEVDPYGERTLGVLTKLDLMDPGTDASDILHNRVIPLRKGYIAVVNRGQLDVDSDLSIRDGLRKEQHYFRNHPVYGHDRSLAGKCGTFNLARQLNTILMHHIRECLPELKSRIANMMNDVHVELEALGSGSDAMSRSNMGHNLLALLSKFTNNFATMIDGRGNMTFLSSSSGPAQQQQPSQQSEMNELFGGARISYIFTEIFAASLMGVGAFDALSDEEIRATICNANGTRPSLFVPEISFDILVRRQIGRLEQPGIQCVDLVYEELQRIASQCEPTELTRFPNLRDRMVEVVSGLLKRAVGPTQMMVSNLVRIELSYINTSHPDFIGGSRAVAQLMQKIEKEKERAAKMQQQQLEELSKHHDGLGMTPSSTTSLINHTGDGTGMRNINNNGKSQSSSDDGHGGIINFIFGNKTPAKQQQQLSKKGGFTSPGPPSIVQLPQVPDTMRHTDVPPTDRERIETEIIKSLIDSYFSIVRKNFIDLVPKTIMYFLVNHVRDAMQNELVAELYRDAEMGSLMTEAEDVAQRRKTCVEMKDLLTKALEIVNEVRDFNTFK